MRKLSTFMSMLLVCAPVVGSSNFQDASPLVQDHSLLGDRLIEPTSVILGNVLVSRIRKDDRHPEEILQAIKDANPKIIRDLQLSTMAYVKTMQKPLQEYCEGISTPLNNEKNHKQVEHAAIPVAVLKHVHPEYLLNVNDLRDNYVLADDEFIKSTANKMALRYQLQKYECPAVEKLEKVEKKFKFIFPKRYDNLVKLNHKISSPEAAFPRLQYGINGLTQYVFSELFNLEYDYLKNLVRVVYDAKKEWVSLRQAGPVKERFISYVENKGLKAGFLPREILLAISYSNRNMPSIDVHYGYDTEKALLLEVYFWKIKEIRELVTDNYLPDLFPNAVLKEDPGLYHYATAALLACDIRLHGYAGATAHFMALMSKIGYKSLKMMTEAARRKAGPKEMIKIAKKQGYQSGVEAGRYGGGHGVKFCRKNTPKNKWFKMKQFSPSNEDIPEDFDFELGGEELPSEMEVLL